MLVHHDETAALFLPSDEAHRTVRERAERAFAEIATRRLREPLPGAPGLFRRLLAFTVEEMQLQIAYGDFLRFLGRYPEAAKAYQRALVLAPDSLDVRLALGAAYWLARSRDQDVQEWLEILRRDPGFKAARQTLVQASREAARPANPTR